MVFLFGNCHKDNQNQPSGCDIQKVYADNASKVTITNGIWGTVSFMEGNCMPTTQPGLSTCKTCPVKRTLRIYEYTTPGNATLNITTTFYDSFSTRLIKEIDTDNDGFFQTNIPSGHYTIVVIENGKLYVCSFDGQGGLNPFTFISGKKNINLTLTYKAVF
ncbi:MAG: hypothetical protein ACR2FN_14705 [Chitinophagaceae bacterium]